MVNWDNLNKTIKDNEQQGKLWVRLEDDGDKVQVVFRGDTYTRGVHWSNKEKTYVDCLGKESCNFCVANYAPSLKISINVAVLEDGKWWAQVWEAGPKFWKKAARMDERKPFTDFLFEIIRDGRRGDSNTDYDLIDVRELSEEEKDHLKFMPLRDLANPKGGDPEEDSFNYGANV